MGDDKIHISWDDTNDPKIDEELRRRKMQQQQRGWAQPVQPAGTPSGKAYPSPKSYGGVPTASKRAAQGNVFYSALLYTAIAGLIAGFVGWLITEGFVSSEGSKSLPAATQVAIFFGLVGACLGAGLCSVEGIVSKTYATAFRSGFIGLILGLIGGGVAGGMGQALYGAGAKVNQSVVLVLDTSNSMTGSPLNELKESSRNLVSSCDRSQFSFGSISFNTTASIASYVSAEPEPTLRAVDSLTASGGTQMLDGLRQGFGLLRDRQGDRNVLLFTDGDPTTSSDAILTELRNNGMSDEESTLLFVGYMSLPPTQRKFGPEAGTEEMPPGIVQPSENARKLVEDAFGASMRKVQMAIINEAKTARTNGTRIIAIGTGEANRDFLAEVTGDKSRVLFANAGELSKAFSQAQQILFRESPQGARGSLQGSNMLIRSICWGIAGMLLTLGQGISMGSGKKTRNALIGGLIGGLFGGVLFDPISAGLKAGWASRMIAVCVIGCSTGVMLGIVESLLKDAWLKVVAGHLDGKEFVIYRNPTVLGSSPKCEIYLFKDGSVEPQHAAISVEGASHFIQDCGSASGTFVNGHRVSRQRLTSGDQIRIGITTLLYSEKTARGV